MSNIPPHLLYTASHEWLQPSDDGSALIGITDFAQAALGDITYVQLPAVGTVLVAGKQFGVIESVKAASDLYAPISGRIVERNDALDIDPAILNRDPYDGGWLLRVQSDGPLGRGEALLSADGYKGLAT